MTDGRGRFIAFEGIEGAGKSTQVALLAAALRRRSFEVVATFEPGGTALGRELREIVMRPTGEPPLPRAELLLYLAARAQHVAQLIRPALARGAVVLCDRFSGSTLAYQGYGRGLDLEMVARLDAAARDGVWPDLTLLLDCPLEEGLRRATGDDRMQRERLAFHRRVRDGFHRLAREDTSWRIVSTDPSREEVARAVLAAVDAILPLRRAKTSLTRAGARRARPAPKRKRSGAASRRR